MKLPAMSNPYYQTVADGIYCIETGLYREGLAACYLVRAQDRLAFIDTGTAHTVPRALALVTELGLTPAHVDYVIPTHVHLDHAGGAGALMAACPNAVLVAHPKGAPHLIDPTKLIAGATAVYGEAAFAQAFGDLVPVPETRVVAADDGQTFDLADRRLTFIHTQGHANHHGCIHDNRSSGLFTGDTFGISYRAFDTVAGPWLFAPTTPVAFDPDAWMHSLDRLMDLKPSAAFLTHYCRIDNPMDQVEQVRRSVQALAEIALDLADQPRAERKDRIHQAITAHLLAGARDHGCRLSDERIRTLLAIDLDLNAQGLEVWLRRREARAETNPR